MRLIVAYRASAFLAVVALFVFGLLWRQGDIDRNRRAATQAQALAVQGKEAHDAICVLKGDLATRIRASRRFLAEHRGDKFILGVPRKTITDSVKNQQHTIDSLRPVVCK